MNYNLFTYLIYALITFTIIIKIGELCFKNGKYFIIKEIKNEDLAMRINNTLLIAYYLVNLGFVLYTFTTWPSLHTLSEIIIELSNRIGFLMILLGILHYFNIYFISTVFKKFINY